MLRLITWLSSHALTVAGFAYLAITLLICFDVVGRRLLGFSTESTTELTGYLMAAAMSWGLAGTLIERAHVRIDVLVQKTPLSVRVWLHGVAIAALLIFGAFMAWGALLLVKDTYEIGATDLSIWHIPLAIPQGVWAAGFALLLLGVLALIARAASLMCNRDYDGIDRLLVARSYVDEATETLEAVGQGRGVDNKGL
ncbi:TRAP transporter small permease subunit [Hydrogenophaga sp. BPS33]|uniref:TRAP transporter small permease subunit n=1 Tax=Hydrogenophaga sp. BPS33 TaxID=2651974 RepID=UPI00131F7C37|nr:TRAP transporter small permease subunit [Hydrogenophaga sp. BPS33]QHE87357.1 TRAP transporter small permease subunit [Hydrogenophaga sp. BPS33]